MKGDFSRITNIETESEHYSMVLMQQGRVQLDADWNEQVLIQWFQWQRLVSDLLGEHVGRDYGFQIHPGEGVDIAIRNGTYYINGTMFINNDNSATYMNQPHFPSPPALEVGKRYLVYLHGWLRHITAVENPYLREVALGGPDTTTRVQNLWSVEVQEVTGTEIGANLKADYHAFRQLLQLDYERSELMARAKKPQNDDNVCIISPSNQYRGVENQLYRVEVHRGGALNETGDAMCATYKWSREDGAVVFPITEVASETVTVVHLGRDNRLGLNVGDWVEVVDDEYELLSEVEDLLKVVAIDNETLRVTLSAAPQRGSDAAKHPLLRRWDHNGDPALGGALKVVMGEWVELEDGIQINFSTKDNALCKTRDWWWIPARTASGDIEWPGDYNNPTSVQALDLGHRYAPLAMVNVSANAVVVETDLRRKIKQLWE